LKQILILYRPLPPIKCARFFLCASHLSSSSFIKPTAIISATFDPDIGTPRSLSAQTRAEGKVKAGLVVHCNTLYITMQLVLRVLMPPHELGQNDVHRINQMAPPHAL